MGKKNELQLQQFIQPFPKAHYFLFLFIEVDEGSVHDLIDTKAIVHIHKHFGDLLICESGCFYLPTFAGDAIIFMPSKIKK
jgi:hypothetical protein